MGLTIWASKWRVEINRSHASFDHDLFQDNGSNGLTIEASTVTAIGITVQGTAGTGIGVGNSAYLVAAEVNVQNNQGGMTVIGHSDLQLINSSVTNTYDGISILAQSAMLVAQDTVTNNGGVGVAIDLLSIVDFYGGGTFSGNGSGVDIWCGGQYAVAWNLANANYGITTCVNAALAAKQGSARPSPR